MGNWWEGGNWDNGEPVAGDTAIIETNITVTDSIVYCKVCLVSSAGTLTINCSSADSGITFDDAANSFFAFTGNGTGVLIMDGTSTYTAKLQQAGSGRQWDIGFSNGTVTMDNAEINYIKPATSGCITITDATISITKSSFLSENRHNPTSDDRWYWSGVPSGFSVDRQSEFENSYYGLESSDYSFRFVEDPSHVEYEEEVMTVENPVIGRTKSRIHVHGVMAMRVYIDGAFNTRDNRFKVGELEEMKNDIGKQFLFYSPDRILPTVTIASMTHNKVAGSPYRNEYNIELVRDE